MRTTEPLPFVPATWTTGNPRCGFPRVARNGRRRDRPSRIPVLASRLRTGWSIIRTRSLTPTRLAFDVTAVGEATRAPDQHGRGSLAPRALGRPRAGSGVTAPVKGAEPPYRLGPRNLVGGAADQWRPAARTSVDSPPVSCPAARVARSPDPVRGALFT